MKHRRSKSLKTHSDSVSTDLHFMLESVQLERFKAAFRPDPLPISPFTVIIGRNGSGKSTVLEALQWLDLAMRQDAVRACERYSGIHDLINIRGRGKNRYFNLQLKWSSVGNRNNSVEYKVRINESSEGRPLIHSEFLVVSEKGKDNTVIITTSKKGSNTYPGRRVLFPGDKDRQRIFDDPDRLALSRLSGGSGENTLAQKTLEALRQFWDRAVFLRLSPHRLAQGSPSKRKSFDPLLDEEGQTLPALLNELTKIQEKDLIDAINVSLPDVTKIDVSETNSSREQNVYWSIREKMPTGYAGGGSYEIPASMLSEGTRRLTAILALIQRDPPPSLLCIEEIENGLDPWTVLDVLNRLKGAYLNGTQTILTSHSPWLLDNVEMNAIRYVQRKGGETKYTLFRSETSKKKFIDSVPPGARYVNL